MSQMSKTVSRMCETDCLTTDSKANLWDPMQHVIMADGSVCLLAMFATGHTFPNVIPRWAARQRSFRISIFVFCRLSPGTYSPLPQVTEVRTIKLAL